MKRWISVGAVIAAVLTAALIVWTLQRPSRGDEDPTEAASALDAPSPADPTRAHAPQHEAPRPNRVVRGKVIDGGQLVAGAEVFAEGYATNTDPEGRFTLLVPGTLSDPIVQARHGARVSPGVRVDEVPSDVELLLGLHAGATALIRVVDPEKRAPVPRVVVELSGPVRTSAVSDARGEAYFAELAPGRYELQAHGEGFDAAGETMLVLAGEGVRRELYVNRSKTIHARVVDARDRRPIAGARVELRSFQEHGHVQPAFVVTQEDGTFTAELLKGQDMALLLTRAPGYRTQLTAGRPHSVREIALERGARLEGRVLLETGAPAPGAQVAFVPARGMQGLAGNEPIVVTADEEGRFAIPGLSPMEGELAALGDFGARSEKTTVDLNRGDELAITLVLPGLDATLAVEVKRRDGTPAAGAVVTVSSLMASGIQARSATADGLGRAEFTVARRASYTVHAELDGTLSDATKHDADERLVRVQLPDAGRRVRGCVQGPDGTPVHRFWAGPEQLQSADGCFDTVVRRDFERIEVASADGRRASAPLPEGEGAVDVGVLRLGALSVVRVRVLDSEGLGVPNLRVSVGPTSSGACSADDGIPLGGDVTNRTGWAELPAEEGQQCVFALAPSEGKPLVAGPISVETGAAAEWTFTVPARSSVRGRVSLGGPVRGAVVEVDSRQGGARTETDERGEFELRVAGRSPEKLRVILPPGLRGPQIFAAQVDVRPDGSADATFDASATLRGEVDVGAFRGPMMVGVAPGTHERPGDFPDERMQVLEVTADRAIVPFELVDLPSGKVSVFVRGGELRAVFPAELRAGANGGLQLKLEPAASARSAP